MLTNKTTREAPENYPLEYRTLTREEWYWEIELTSGEHMVAQDPNQLGWMTDQGFVRFGEVILRSDLVAKATAKSKSIKQRQVKARASTCWENIEDE